MNYKMIFHTTGQVLKIVGILLALPLVVSLCYAEFSVALAFGITIVIALLVGFLFTLMCKGGTQVFFSKEGFVIVALAWISVSLVGALPFVISGEIPNYIDALFETVSGFTTTGASILIDVECLSHGIQFWRCFTHWVGGMGVLVFVMAITAKTPDRSIYILRAEMPGPIVDKLVPRSKDTAKILYLIYIGFTVLEMVFLLFGGMSFYESVLHAFGTAGTGGFGLKNDSIAGYSPYIQFVIAAFMLLFGINFNLYFLIIMRKFGDAFKSRELWTYFGIVGTCIVVISLNILKICASFGEAFRLSFFQVASFVTTTGFGTADFNAWPNLSKGLLLTLMFFGGCAGSTAGGFKISRVMILFSTVRKELRRIVHPRTASIVKFEGKKVDESTINGVGSYLAIYCFTLAVCFILLTFDRFDFEMNFTASVSCLNNIGPFFSTAFSNANYSAFSPFSKIVLSFAMLFGRLEIYPLFVALNPKTWIKNK